MKVLPFIILLIVSICFPQCANGQSKSSKKWQEGKRKQFELSNNYIAMNMHELLTVYSRRIEWKMDSIMNHESSGEVRNRQIVLKSNLLNSIAETGIHPDPLAAAIDSWVLCYQLLDYFETKNCTDLYGGACKEMDWVFEKYASAFSIGFSNYISQEDRERIRAYASQYPIQDQYLSRRSIIYEISEWISSEHLGIKSGLLTMPELMRYMGNQVEYFSSVMPKQMLWQMDMRLGALPLDSMMFLLADMQRLMNASADLFENTEDMIRDSRDSLLGNLDYQRRMILYMIRQERIETLNSLSQERIAILNALREERMAIEDFIEEQREAVTSDLSSGTSGMVEQSTDVAMELIDYLFIRALIFGGLFAAVIFAAIWFYKK